ncbi:MAG: DUF1150 domain-containing protein [Deltaproteobacteria bacterium]|nr:DUF1150 domain-containing protein [Deltaproteobacteria bacterium]
MNKTTDDKTIEPNTAHPAITQDALAHLGDGRLAYVKPIRSEDVAHLFPQAPLIAPGIKLFALHAADGTPIMLTDTREAALANAWSQELEAVSVH